MRSCVLNSHLDSRLFFNIEPHVPDLKDCPFQSWEALAITHTLLVHSWNDPKGQGSGGVLLAHNFSIRVEITVVFVTSMAPSSHLNPNEENLNTRFHPFQMGPSWLLDISVTSSFPFPSIVLLLRQSLQLWQVIQYLRSPAPLVQLYILWGRAICLLLVFQTLHRAWHSICRTHRYYCLTSKFKIVGWFWRRSIM